MSKPILVALVLALACCWPMAASAQGGDNIVQPTEAQFQLYEEGFEAFRAEDYAKAIDLFKASLHLGELNITYLNLGRAYYKAGRCVEARKAYDKVPGAPQISEPTPVQVLGKLEEYRKDLEATCQGVLVLACKTAGTTVSVDGGAPLGCAGQSIEVAPGKHTLVATLGEETQQREVTVTAAEQADIEFTLAPKAPVVGPSRPQGPSVYATLGWVQVGVSAASLAAGVFFFFDARTNFEQAEQLAEEGRDRPAFNTAVDDTQTSTTLSNFFYGLSAVTLASGAVFLFLLDDSGEEAPQGTGLQLLVAPGAVGIGGSF